MKMNVKKGDTVKVIAGKDKGKEGEVLRSVPESGRVVVEKVNMIKKAMKPNAKYPQGGLIDMEAPIHISNLALIDPKSGKPTRIGRRRNENGKLVRYAKKSGEEIK